MKRHASIKWYNSQSFNLIRRNENTLFVKDCRPFTRVAYGFSVFRTNTLLYPKYTPHPKRNRPPFFECPVSVCPVHGCLCPLFCSGWQYETKPSHMETKRHYLLNAAHVERSHCVCQKVLIMPLNSNALAPVSLLGFLFYQICWLWIEATVSNQTAFSAWNQIP